jgi:hypothetical protein
MLAGLSAYLHNERLVGVHEKREEVQVKRRAEVVSVRDKHVLDAGIKQLLQLAAPRERRVQVAMPGRAPLFGWVGG